MVKLIWTKTRGKLSKLKALKWLKSQNLEILIEFPADQQRDD